MADRRTSPFPSYSDAAITLHWLIAVLILTNIALAWIWDPLDHSGNPADKLRMGQLVALHKSVGLTVLVLSLVRLGIRLARGFPSLPNHMAVWERVLARATHIAFYVLMIGTPLLGWALASSGKRPIPYFGLFEWPKLPVPADKALGHQIFQAHGTAATLILITLALHVLGALKHQFFDKDWVLHRMLPIVKQPNRS